MEHRCESHVRHRPRDDGALRHTVCAIAMLALAAGCATPRGAEYVPVVDMQGKDAAKFQSDLAQCQQYAKQRDETMEKAMAGAVAGALVGAIIAPKGYRQNLANRGALLGAGVGAADAIETQETIIKRCLSGRGYNVLS